MWISTSVREWARSHLWRRRWTWRSEFFFGFFKKFPSYLLGPIPCKFVIINWHFQQFLFSTIFNHLSLDYIREMRHHLNREGSKIINSINNNKNNGYNNISISFIWHYDASIDSFGPALVTKLILILTCLIRQSTVQSCRPWQQAPHPWQPVANSVTG